jgi:hypothetical protein
MRRLRVGRGFREVWRARMSLYRDASHRPLTQLIGRLKG